MKITSKKQNIGSLLPAGDHVVTITECGMELSKENSELWADQTQQLKVVMKNDKGMITSWLNLEGFKNKKDYPDGVAPKGFDFRQFDENSDAFLVNTKTNKRVRSQERTDKLLAKVGNLAFVLGFEEDADFELDEVIASAISSEIGVRIRENNKGKLEPFHFIPANEVAVEA
jgi:hypothetical protein